MSSLAFSHPHFFIASNKLLRSASKFSLFLWLLWEACHTISATSFCLASSTSFAARSLSTLILKICPESRAASSALRASSHRLTHVSRLCINLSLFSCPLEKSPLIFHYQGHQLIVSLLAFFDTFVLGDLPVPAWKYHLMELSRDFVPPVFMGVLPLFGALRSLGGSPPWRLIL